MAQFSWCHHAVELRIGGYLTFAMYNGLFGWNVTLLECFGFFVFSLKSQFWGLTTLRPWPHETGAPNKNKVSVNAYAVIEGGPPGVRNNYEAHKLSLFCHQMMRAMSLVRKHMHQKKRMQMEWKWGQSINVVCYQSNVQKTSQTNLLD